MYHFMDRVFLQPDDHGLIGDVPVLRVTREGADAIHFVGFSLEVGQEVLLKLDWDRRFDHMQQHSGENSLKIHTYHILQESVENRLLI